MLNPKVVVLEVWTYIGASPGASHWRGALTCGSTRVVLSTKLTKRSLARVIKSFREGAMDVRAKMLEVGDKVEFFVEREDVVGCAIKQWKKHFPDALVLLEGYAGYAEPKQILDGVEPEVAKILNRAAERYEIVGDTMPETAEKLNRQWHKTLKLWIEAHQ